MCGLIGFSGKENADLNIIKLIMLHNSMSRGKHATGIYSKSNKIIKRAKDAETFLSDPNIKIETDPVFMGHVRHATVGNKEDDNLAHPFSNEHIIFQHNGTLKNYQKLAKRFDIKEEDYGVDSELLGQIINKCWNSDKPFEVMEHYEGAAATMTYDKKNDVLYVSRDEERTLFYGRIGTGLYISSIETSLKMVGAENIRAFAPYLIYKIKEGQIASTVKYKKKESVATIQGTADHMTIIKTADGETYIRPAIHLAINGFKYSTNILPLLTGHILEVSYGGTFTTKGKSYRVLGPDDSAYHKNRVKIINDQGNIDDIPLAQFKTEKGFPHNGREVIVIYPDMFTESVEIGELARVEYYSFGQSEIFLKLQSGAIVKSDISHIRVLTEKEQETLDSTGELDLTDSIEDILTMYYQIQEEVFEKFPEVYDMEGEGEEDEESIELMALYEESVDTLLEQIQTLTDSCRKNLEEINGKGDEVNLPIGFLKGIQSLLEKYKGKKVLNI